jgi:hypothetical protein
MNFSLLLGIISGLSIFIIALSIGSYKMFTASKSSIVSAPIEFNKSIAVAVYFYEKDINGLDDINAKRMGIYRDQGVIIRMEDETPILERSFYPTKENASELGQIIRSAIEVKRVTDRTVLYFFKHLKPLKVKTPRVAMIDDSINTGIEKNQPVVLKLTETDLEADL